VIGIEAYLFRITGGFVPSSRIPSKNRGGDGGTGARLINLDFGGWTMNFLSRMFVRLREWHHELSDAQTTSEYALIVFAIAIALIIGYEGMGQSLSSMVNNLDVSLSA
jgi:Flp pilus assembly pilin Flp